MADSTTGGVPHQVPYPHFGVELEPAPAPDWVEHSTGFGDNRHRGHFGEQFVRMLAVAANLAGQGYGVPPPFLSLVLAPTDTITWSHSTCARAAAEETLEQDSLADFEPYAEAGLSVNLCEALVRTAGEERRGFSFAFAWSPEVRMEQASSPVEIARRHVEVLEEGAKDLGARLGRGPEALLRGVVTRLSGQGDREAAVYGSLLHEEDTRVRSVRVDLRPEDVDKATRAWRRGLEVAGDG
ncbi:hypothetical protein [Streptomyces albogriseolus]|uniref:hypothetical protein n=1 Tax=Streptomyces albogriseolus TaxID=1887 RepID=UPI003D759A92